MVGQKFSNWIQKNSPFMIKNEMQIRPIKIYQDIVIADAY